MERAHTEAERTCWLAEAKTAIVAEAWAAYSQGCDRGRSKAQAMADDYTLGDVVRLIDALAESTQAGFNRVDARLDGIDARLDGIDARLDGIDARLDRIETKLDRHETRIEALESKFL